jgi:hypothetical protein
VAGSVAVAVIVVVAGAPVGASIAPEPVAPPALVERQPCAGSTPPSTGVSAASSGGVSAGNAPVTFFVPPTVRVLLDDGRPVAAMTNTGCAPRAGDSIVVGLLPAPSSVTTVVLACSTSGDWTRGGWVPLAC